MDRQNQVNPAAFAANDFTRPVELKCVLNVDATMKRMIPTLAFQAVFVWVVAAFAVGLIGPKLTAVVITVATAVSVGSVLWVYIRTRHRLRKTYGQLQRLVLEPDGLHRYDEATQIDMPWVRLAGFEHRNSSLPGRRVWAPTPAAPVANAALRQSHTLMAWGIVGYGTLSPLPTASRRRLKILDGIYHSSLRRGQPIQAEHCLIFPGEFEQNWTTGVIGGWLRHYRPDLALPAEA
jgi:hypothetical protein